MAKLGQLPQNGSFVVNDQVLVGATQELGTILFIGSTQFSAGEWVGVALDKPLGKNDGTVKDVKYFDCKKNHGLFVRKTALLPQKQAEAASNPAVAPVQAEAASKPAAKPKHRGAAALMKGLKSGEVGQIVDKMEEPAESPNQEAAPTSPASKPSSPSAKSAKRASSSTRPAATPLRERKSGVSAGLDPEVAAVLTELRTATEDRDVDQLRSSIQKALHCGVVPEEIAAAQRILNFESQKALCKEIDKVRSVVAGLAESVRQTQARVSTVESSGTDSEWVVGVVQRIEQQVWKTLEQRVEERIQSAVRSVARELFSNTPPSPKPDMRSASSTTTPQDQAALRIQSAQRGRAQRQELKKQNVAATKLQSAWRRKLARQSGDPASRSFAAAVVTARSRNKAWANIFDEFCIAGGAGLDAAGFHKAVIEIHPRLAMGQTTILFKGYTQGTGSSTVELSGFVSIAEAIAIGDGAASEFADVNEEIFQALGRPGADEAALKIQAVRRGQAARAEIRAPASAPAPAAARPVEANQNTARVEELRALAKKRLSAANLDGSLKQSFLKLSSEKADAGRVADLRSRAKEGLSKANADGTLRDATSKRLDQADAGRVADLRSRAKEGLQKANADGTLRDATSKRRDQAASEPLGAGAEAIGAGTVLVCVPQGNFEVKEVDMFESVDSDKVVGTVKTGDQVVAWGPPFVVDDGCMMLPLKPFGAVVLDNFQVRSSEELILEQQRNKAASSIQSAQRGKAVRKEAKQRDEAAKKIQRRWRSRRNGDSWNPLSAIVRSVQTRNRGWCTIFEQNLGNSTSKESSVLTDGEFDQAMQQVLPGRVTSAQSRALFKGYVSQTGGSGVDLVGFSGMAEAVATGDDAAAEYADMDANTYCMMGDPDADAASSKIGAAIRGRQQRAQMAA